MPEFIVCMHDATPAYARETEAIIRDLTPLIGRSIAFGVVPDWNGEWPLGSHPDYSRMISEHSGEIMLHGYFHSRRRGAGPVSLLTGGSDEMNGLDPAETLDTLGRGQGVLNEVFGAGRRGFLPPAWQHGHVKADTLAGLGLDYVMGFFSLQAAVGRKVALATWTWDCGRWVWLGHIGHGIGSLGSRLGGGVPVLAIHPNDVHRGFWPKILRVTRELLERGYEPSSISALIDRKTVGAAA